MGRDKDPKPTTNAASSIHPVELGPDGKPKRPPKGHRQKGAGTVITAKPPVVTGDGIVLKIHERLPSQLLQEYCQREKRPPPRFFPNPPGHRMRVVCVDPKNNKNDLTFCPNQSFDSDSIARDFAALLALFHFQKAFPLERKLPEPYSTTWTTMLANEKIEKAATAAAQRAGGSRTLAQANAKVGSTTTPTAAGATEQPNRKLPASAVHSEATAIAAAPAVVEVIVPELDRNTSDWLCDNCGNQNFATLASGVLRKKCFKCQAGKTDTCTLVASTAAVANASTAKSSTSGMGVSVMKANVSSSSNNSQQSTSNSSQKQQPATKVKAAPAAVINLKSDRPFSKQDADKARLERQAARKRKQAYFDALKRANKPMPVYLGATLRKMLESVLKLSQQGDDSSGVNSAYGEDDENGATLTVDGFLNDYSELITFSEEVCLVTSDSQQDLLREIVASFVKKGFTEHDTVKCLQLLLLTQYSEELLEAIEAALAVKSGASSIPLRELVDSSIVRGVYAQCITEATLSQLCMQLDESKLPVAFDPRKAEKSPVFDVYRPQKAEADPSSSLSDSELAALTTLKARGWTTADCHAALTIAGCVGGRAGDGEVLPADTVALLAQAALSQAAVMNRCTSFGRALALKMASTHLLCPCGSVASSGDLEALLEEIESLDAIFGSDKFQATVLPSGRGDGGSEMYFHMLTLQIDLVEAASTPKAKQLLAGQYSIVVYVPTVCNGDGDAYPNALPMVTLQTDCPLSTLSAPQCQALTVMQCALWTKAASEFLGECMVFQVYSYLLDSVDTILASVAAANGSNTVAAELQRVKEFVESGGTDPTDLIPPVTDRSETAGDAAEDDAKTDNDTVSSGQTKRSGGDRGRNKGSHPFWVRNSHSNNKASGSSARSAAYNSMQKVRQTLPAWEMRSEFLDLLSRNRGLVVTGETGCGKTTQIPQFIHEEQPEAKIVICQPRRLAAIGVATRIADEMASTVGEVVGYMVKGDSKAGAKTRIVFCTYGVLLRRLQDDPTLKAVDYVVLDEVHERGIDSDFTLALLMSAAAERPDLKVLLMSATIATERFASYLASVATPSVPSVPVMFIPGFTFPVTEFYRNDYEEVVRSAASGGGKQSSGGTWNRGDQEEEDIEDEDGSGARRNSGGDRIGGKQRKGDLDYDLIVRLIATLCGHTQPRLGSDTDPAMLARATGSVLVFMPGVPEINRVMTLLQSTYGSGGGGALTMRTMALHGMLSPAEQKRVFQPAGRGDIKIIVATNVAEASITIPDVSVVVDTCRVKEMGFDYETQTSALVMKFAAQDSLLQRRGRAGRVSHGRCFRLVSRTMYDKLPAHGLPEILRSPLDSVILQIKAMLLNMPVAGTTDSMHILSRCLDSPAESVVRVAEQALVKIQALDPATSGLTALGKHLSTLPCTPRIGRLLIYGALLGCVYPTSCVAACLTARSPFLSSNDPEMIKKVNAAKTRFGEGSSIKSDYNIIVRAMAQFETTRDRRGFCREFGLSFERMTEIRQSQGDLLRGLVEIGFIDDSSSRPGSRGHANRNSDKPKLVAAVYCAGLYPQLAKILRPPKRFVEVMGSALERDAESNEIKLYIPDQLVLDAASGVAPRDANRNSNSNSEEFANSDVDINVSRMQRVFMHPSTVNFSNVSFRASNFVLYGERQLVTRPGSDDYKLYLRDTTEVTAFALLFFGGRLETSFVDGIVTVDGWIRFSATGRIVALVQAIRRAFDRLLEDKILHPDCDISSSPVLDVTCCLLETDGLG